MVDAVPGLVTLLIHKAQGSDILIEHGWGVIETEGQCVDRPVGSLCRQVSQSQITFVVEVPRLMLDHLLPS